jgi:DNA-binding response OmpR family regulator
MRVSGRIIKAPFNRALRLMSARSSMSDYTILLIDYDPDSAARLCRPLQRAGYRVEIATDGLAGISRFHELTPDLTLIEAMIPKKHGFEVCLELKGTPHGQNTEVWILTSVYKGRKYRTQAHHHYKCDQYLEKPIAEEALMASVDGYFSERTRQAEVAANEDIEAIGETGQGSVTSFDPERKRSVQDQSETRHPMQIPAPGEGPRMGGAQSATVPEMHIHANEIEPLRSETPVEPAISSANRDLDEPKRGRVLLWIALALLVALGGVLLVTVVL